MTNKDLYLNVCQALSIEATNTKSKHDKLINNEGILWMVEIVGRKFGTTCHDIKEGIKFLSAETIAEKLAAENLAEIPSQDGINTIGSHNSDLSNESTPLIHLRHQQKTAEIAAVKVIAMILKTVMRKVKMNAITIRAKMTRRVKKVTLTTRLKMQKKSMILMMVKKTTMETIAKKQKNKPQMEGI
jgi:hypothetical protein